MDLHCQMIIDEYLENRESFDKIKEILVEELNKIIKELGLYVVAVEARVKEEKSLSGKLELKGYKYASLADITDIVGARVVTFYIDDVDRISALLEKRFIIDWENSVDKRKLSNNEFGYMSLHYICQIPESLYYDPEHPEINETKIEVQLRTALQHVWATINHDTGYKSDIEIPAKFKRGLNRLAGLLEIADDEFKTISDSIDMYRSEVAGLIKDSRFEDIELNGDSFKDYIAIKPFESLSKKIADVNHAELTESNMQRFLNVLKWLEFENLGQIEDMRKDYEEDAYRLGKHQIVGRDIDILSESIGLQNLCIIYILKHEGREQKLKQFFDKLNGEKPRNIKSAERIIKEAKEINII
ncbi:MAG: (p)ppGpp synthetase [Clostridia bacterium]|nr:(p)ppGpp synthetase [Clostridia bacterium]